MKAFWAIVKKELRSVTREKTIMIAIAIQLFIASFSSVILVGLLSFYDPDSIGANFQANLGVGVLGDAGTPLINFLRARGMRATYYAAPADAERAFQRGVIDAITYVPAEQAAPVEMELVLPQSEARASMILILLKEPLKQYENWLRRERGVDLKYTSATGLPSTSYEFLYSIIVPVLMFFPAFVAGSMAVDSTAEEIENQTLDTLRAAPISIRAILGSKIAAALIVAVLQCGMWILLLRLNRISLQNIPLVLLLAILVAAINAVASASVASVFRDRERSQFFYSILILAVISLSAFLNFSPITLMTRLATGDVYTGFADVAVYGLVLIALLAVFTRAVRRLTAA
jgi:ABC-type Na+ efflux pump permease subunit